jgi:hypothetical protein
MEYDGRFIRVLEEQLLQNIEHDGEHDKGCCTGGEEDGERRIGGEVTQWTGDVGENTHGGRSEAQENSERVLLCRVGGNWSYKFLGKSKRTDRPHSRLLYGVPIRTCTRGTLSLSAIR